MEVKDVDSNNEIYIKNFKFFKRLVLENYLLTSAIVITVVLFLFFCINRNNTDNCSISNSSSSLSMRTQEIEEFNDQFNTFYGIQKGDNLKSLCDLLIHNANSYNEEKEQLPIIILNDDNEVFDFIIDRTDNNDRIMELLTNLRNSLIEQSKYNVEFDYKINGLIDKITITGKFNRNNVYGGE